MFTPLAPVSAASSTSIGKKSASARRRRVPRELQVGGRPLALEQHAPLADLRGSAGARAAPAAAPPAIVPKCVSRAAQDVIGVHVADNHQRGVPGNVVLAVVTVQIVAGHRPEIVDPADRRMAVGVRAERGRGDLGVEQLVGIVLAALQLGDDDRALGLALLAARRGRAPSARPR